MVELWIFQNQRISDERADGDLNENFSCICIVGLSKKFQFSNFILIMVFHSLRKC